jgi:hypothetical protein
MARATDDVPGEPAGDRDDQVQGDILRHLLEVHRKSRSPKSAAVGFRKLQQALKKKFNYKASEVSSNLDYLVQKDWVKDVHEPRSFTTDRGTRFDSEQLFYKISDSGIDLFRGDAHMYQHRPTGSQINITTIDGVTVVGDRNIVNTQAAGLPGVLEKLREAVISSEEYEDEAKLNIAADIDTLQVQLQKPKLDKGLLKKAWTGVQTAVTAGEAVDLAAKASMLIASLVN